jgi:hypothetical protein
VVNEFGQVFDGSQPANTKAVLKGLFVVDGATIPGALAANPYFYDLCPSSQSRYARALVAERSPKTVGGLA